MGAVLGQHGLILEGRRATDRTVKRFAIAGRKLHAGHQPSPQDLRPKEDQRDRRERLEKEQARAAALAAGRSTAMAAQVLGSSARTVEGWHPRPGIWTTWCTGGEVPWGRRFGVSVGCRGCSR